MRKQSLSLAAVAAGAALALSACGGVSTSTGGGSGEGAYPSGSVEMYVGADPGGSSDLISRQVSAGLTDELGEQFPVINQSGANGALAANKVESSDNDGSVIAIQNASLFAITPLASPRTRSPASTTSTTSAASRATTTCWSPTPRTAGAASRT